MSDRNRKRRGSFKAMQREMERMFNDMRGLYPASGFCALQAWRPPTDVYETKEALVVKIELAGMREKEIDVTLDGRTLLVSGTRADHRHSERISYYLMGINYGSFCMQIYLPYTVEGDAVRASYEDGFLIIHLPRREKEGKGPSRVDIQR